MKYLGKVITISAVILLLLGCAEKPLDPVAQAKTPPIQSVPYDSEKHRLPVGSIL